MSGFVDNPHVDEENTDETDIAERMGEASGFMKMARSVMQKNLEAKREARASAQRLVSLGSPASSVPRVPLKK